VSQHRRVTRELARPIEDRLKEKEEFCRYMASLFAHQADLLEEARLVIESQRQ
jgi:hypothetical protein